MNPVVVTGFIKIGSWCSPGWVQRNPGAAFKLFARPRISLCSIRATTKKRKGKRNAVRRCSVTTATCVAAHALRGAHIFRRSTAVLTKGSRRP